MLQSLLRSRQQQWRKSNNCSQLVTSACHKFCGHRITMRAHNARIKRVRTQRQCAIIARRIPNSVKEFAIKACWRAPVFFSYDYTQDIRKNRNSNKQRSHKFSQRTQTTLFHTVHHEQCTTKNELAEPKRKTTLWHQDHTHQQQKATTSCGN